MEEDGKDEEGYYSARAGDFFNKERYAIVSAVGRGVFSSVLRAKDTHRFDSDVAIKVIRNNETMTKLAQKELALLEELRQAGARNISCTCALNQYVNFGYHSANRRHFYRVPTNACP